MSRADAARGRRGLALAAVLIAAGSGLVLLAGTQPLLVTPAGSVLSDDAPSVGGPLASAVGLVGLAAAGALLLTGRWVRRGVGALVLAGALALLLSGGGDATAGEAVGVHTGAAWSWVFRAGALVMGVGGSLMLLAAGSWPQPGARYRREPHGGESPGAARDEPAAEPAAGPSAERPAQPSPAGQLPDRSLWEALDRGEDPTA